MGFLRSMVANRRRAALAAFAAIVVIVVLAFVGSQFSFNFTTGDAELLGAYFKLPVFPKTGSHKVMVFSEMHYQRSYRVQDLPRVLPPSASVVFVPMGGPDGVTQGDMIRQELLYDSLDEHRGLQVPDRVVRTYDASRAAELFRVNCVMCHGASMKGDGPIATLMTELPVEAVVEKRDPRLTRVPFPKKLGPAPANLNLPITQDSLEGEIFAYITWGGRQGSASVFRGRESRSPMPPFLWLLSEDDRWALVQYVLGR